MPAVKGGSSWPAEAGAALTACRNTSAARQVAERHEGEPVVPLVGLGPGFRIEIAVEPRVLYRQYRPIAWTQPEGDQPSLRIEADSPRRGGQARAAAFPGYARASPAHRARNRNLPNPPVRPGDPPTCQAGSQPVDELPGTTWRSTAPRRGYEGRGAGVMERGRITRQL